MNDNYNKQAKDFLNEWGIKIKIRESKKQSPPPWKGEDSFGGIKYDVKLSQNRKSVSFSFWGSIANREKGVAPSNYDVLACLSSDIDCPDNFGDFCREFGYADKDFETFKRCEKFSKELLSFFVGEMREDLREIR